MNGSRPVRSALLAALVLAASAAMFAAPYAIHHAGSARAWACAFVAGAVAAALAVYGARRGIDAPSLGVALAAGALAGLALCDLFHLRPYLLLPVDLLSFSESPFVTDLIKLRLGQPLYTPVQDNNSFPYSPGTQVLTYALARLAGDPTSIPLLRCIQFGYVIAAVAVSAATARALTAEAGSAAHGAWLWSALALPFLLLVATDPRVNMYTHTLHNDGLLLLVSACAGWLLVAHSRAPQRWHVVAMVLLPAAGFFVKQSALFWIGPFALQLWSSRAGLRKVVAYAAAAGALVLVLVGACWRAWGQPYLEWTFGALGTKEVALANSFDHALDGSGYVALGLAGGFALVLAPRRTKFVWPWLACFVLFAVEAYTSGIAAVSNHLGPSALLMSTWFVAALTSEWREGPAGRWSWSLQLVQAVIPCALVGALGLVRPPINVLPKDVQRYVAAIEREFEGRDAREVLLDTGSWIYLREGVLMMDRSAPVSLHVGENQPVISHAALAETIERLRSRRYARILAREIDTPATRYDFGDRGSGVKQAILDNYRIVRRIPAVANVRTWWPKHLLSEIAVLEPRDDLDGR